jgi:hypothetical protein
MEEVRKEREEKKKKKNIFFVLVVGWLVGKKLFLFNFLY